MIMMSPNVFILVVRCEVAIGSGTGSGRKVERERREREKERHKDRQPAKSMAPLKGD